MLTQECGQYGLNSAHLRKPEKMSNELFNESGESKGSCGSAKMVTKESIEVIAQSIGLSSLSPDVSAALAPDVEYRVREVMQEAIKCMRHARRTTLMAHDVDSALHFRNLEPTCGFTSSKTTRFKRAPDHRDLYFLDDKDVELKNVIEAPLPNAPPDASIISHWLTIDGIQPSIPQNCSLEAISDLKRSEYKEDGLASRHVLSKELQIYFDKVTEWTLTLSGSTLFTHALVSLETDPGVHPLVPFFTSFIAEEIVKNMDNYPILLALMRLARSLLQNPHVHIEPYLHQLMPSLITCLIAKRLGRRLSDNHWDLRNLSASTIASTCKRFGHVYHNLLPRVTRSLLHTFLDPTKALPQHYGAIQGIAALGLNVVRFLVLPNLEPYLQLLLPEMVPEKQKDEAKRHGAWLVYGALMVASGRCLYERLKTSQALLSPPPARSVWKTDGKLTIPRQSKRKASSDNLTHQPPLKKIAAEGSMQMQMHGNTVGFSALPQQSPIVRDIAPRTSAAVGTDVDHFLIPLSEYFGESMLMFTPKHELSFFL